MKPVIGLTCSLQYKEAGKYNVLKKTYIDAIIKAGGIPLILPVGAEEDSSSYINKIDGLLLTGGEDLSPYFYDEDPIKEIREISVERDNFELSLFKEAYKQNKPIMGICRGLQLINVALGGSLYQDIYVTLKDVLMHNNIDRLDQGYHFIEIDKKSSFYEIVKKNKLFVNTNHHQAIKKLGKDLKVVATTSDGIIEVVESTKNSYILGMQFHLEEMISEENYFDIFNFFVNKCK